MVRLQWNLMKLGKIRPHIGSGTILGVPRPPGILSISPPGSGPRAYPGHSGPGAPGNGPSRARGPGPVALYSLSSPSVGDDDGGDSSGLCWLWIISSCTSKNTRQTRDAGSSSANSQHQVQIHPNWACPSGPQWPSRREGSGWWENGDFLIWPIVEVEGPVKAYLG